MGVHSLNSPTVSTVSQGVGVHSLLRKNGCPQSLQSLQSTVFHSLSTEGGCPQPYRKWVSTVFHHSLTTQKVGVHSLQKVGVHSLHSLLHSLYTTHIANFALLEAHCAKSAGPNPPFPKNHGEMNWHAYCLDYGRARFIMGRKATCLRGVPDGARDKRGKYVQKNTWYYCCGCYRFGNADCPTGVGRAGFSALRCAWRRAP
jgi:hypothetical protein